MSSRRAGSAALDVGAGVAMVGQMMLELASYVLASTPVMTEVMCPWCGLRERHVGITVGRPDAAMTFGFLGALLVGAVWPEFSSMPWAPPISS